MSQTCRPILYLSLLLLLLVSCTKDEVSKADAGALPEEPAAGEPLVAPVISAPTLLGQLTIDSSSSRPVTLAYKPVDSLVYAVTLHQSTSQSRGGKEMTVGNIQTFELERKLRSQAEEGWVSELSLANVKVRPDDKSKDKETRKAFLAFEDTLKAARFNIKSDPLGRVLDFSVATAGSGPWQELKDVFEQLTRDCVVTLPEKPVKAGESWKSDRESVVRRVRTANRIAYDLTTTFLGVASLEGRCARCAVLRTAGTIDIVGDIVGSDLKGKTHGKGAVDSVAVLDLERGVLVRSELASATQQLFTLTGTKGGDVTFSEKIATELSQDLLPPKPAGEPAKTEKQPNANP
jgi:hypothetical protein